MALQLADTPAAQGGFGMEGETPMALIDLGYQTLLPAGSAQSAPRTVLVCYLSLFLSSSGCSGTASIQGAGWCRCRIQPRDSWGGWGRHPEAQPFPSPTTLL